MTKKALLAATGIGLSSFVALRLAVLPSQLNLTPYRDDTLGEDLLRLFVLRVPLWVFAVSAAVFAIALWFTKKKRHREPTEHPYEKRA